MTNPNGYDLIDGVPKSNGCQCVWSSEIGWSARHCTMHRKDATVSHANQTPARTDRSGPQSNAVHSDGRMKWGTSPKFPRRESERAS